MTEFLYADKKNRDAAASELKKSGHLVKKFSLGPQQLHPQYLEDRKDTYAGRDTGFGNEAYKTMFSNVYALRVVNSVT